MTGFGEFEIVKYACATISVAEPRRWHRFDGAIARFGSS